MTIRTAPRVARRCPRCQTVKALADFPPAPSRPHAVGPYCRPCHAADARRRRSTPEGMAAAVAATRRYRATEAGRAANAAAARRYRAKKRAQKLESAMHEPSSALAAT